MLWPHCATVINISIFLVHVLATVSALSADILLVPHRLKIYSRPRSLPVYHLFVTTIKEREAMPDKMPPFLCSHHLAVPQSTHFLLTGYFSEQWWKE